MSNIADQFKGLPMESLIGGPLKAACDANVLMAKATSDYIKNIGFDTVGEGDSEKQLPRMVDFSYERPNTDKDGNRVIDLVKVKVPILAIVPIPNLQVNNVDVTFDMEVKNSSTSTDKYGYEASSTAEASYDSWWGASASIKISGSVSSSSENTRSSDSSAKYHVEVNATNFGMPEGLARILDMMNQAAQPRQVEQYQVDKEGKADYDSEPKLVDNEGNESGTDVKKES